MPAEKEKDGVMDRTADPGGTREVPVTEDTVNAAVGTEPEGSADGPAEGSDKAASGKSSSLRDALCRLSSACSKARAAIGAFFRRTGEAIAPVWGKIRSGTKAFCIKAGAAVSA
ncbi:MAG: hypothetical protein J5744_03675, partial [Oscillospiraceae bacterium]|nr:hypothetical protein [Oscillospiraceae bacterium]